MYHLCFATFIEKLMLCQTGNGIGVGRNQFALDFLGVFWEDIKGTYNNENYMGYFMRRDRNLPGPLTQKLTSIRNEDHSYNMKNFIYENLCGDKEEIRKAILSLVENAQNISNEDKAMLTKIIKNEETYAFLKEVFYYVIDNTTNQKINIDKSNEEELQNTIIATEDNHQLERLCLIAFDMKNTRAMHLCFEKMTNAVHISRVIEYVVKNDFQDDESMKDFIDKMISKISNNVYLDRIFKIYLSTDGISYEDKIQFIDKHFHQISNNKYLFDVLVFLYKNNFKEKALEYKSTLTNKTYVGRFEELISLD
ncbi:hypothetical protein SGODD07_02014 [Streptococcus gordonii]|uniref:Uncharacterized protein n=1 Tax=Streptococcus gordonii TaxID=1302 RepID=A0A139MZ37_STRGN|nr:hypothetical protein SGODD07_02014 [Streptococcus gordonii]